MLHPTNPSFLRSVLFVDAVTCAAMGALMTFGSGLFGRLTQIPPELLFYAGLSLFPIAAFITLVATRPVIPAAGVWLIVAGNLLWAAGSVLLLATGWIAPNLLGSSFITAQAIVVAVLTKLEHGALPIAVAPLRAGR